MKSKMILLLIATLFIGMCVNIPTNDDVDRVTQDKLDKFEENIVIKDNDFQNVNNDIEPGVVNNTGKKVEDLIDKGFDFCFGIIKGMMDNNE